MKKLIKTKGQGLLEFALILPILLGILLGIVEAAMVIQGHLAAQHIARETARWAVTYQPVQGACIDRDRDRHLADDGVGDDVDDYAPYPNCPIDTAPFPNPLESDEKYAHRRVDLIKQKARDTAAGLRIREEYPGLKTADFNANIDQPGFFGVRVWGYPSFETDCNDPDLANKVWDPDDPTGPGCLDHPGQEGLAVRVQVVHNVEIIDPLYRVIAESVKVQADAQMINEGVQVGYGNEVPPGFGHNPNPVVGPPGGDDPTPGDPPTPTPIPPTPTLPPNYTIVLTAHPEGTDYVVNQLPDDRCHDFIATLSYEGDPIPGFLISFSTTRGAFNQSGINEAYVESMTNALGQALVTLCGNEPGTADLRAWIDINGNDIWEGEISDTAQKEWPVPSGPYILVNDHEVVALDDNSADIMNHPITLTSNYDVYWCVHPSAGPETVDNNQLLMTVTVDGAGNAEDELFTVPMYSDGLYRLETHPAGGGGCGAADLVAYSGRIVAVVALPDLTITFSDPGEFCPQTYFTVSATIENTTSGTSDEYFDVDFYVDPIGTPYSPIGQRKQWVNGIGPFETVVVNAVLWVEDPGVHKFFARVDTSDFVFEGNEGNNTDEINKATGTAADFTADFDAGWDGFTYSAGAFDSTSNTYYERGDRVVAGGVGGSGGLRIRLGDRDNNSIDDMSGGFVRTFTLGSPDEVTILFDYHLTQARNYESNEYSQVLVRVDSGANQVVATITGDGNGGPDKSTGWQSFQLDAGTLSAGDHTLTVGGYNNRKTSSDESTTIVIDNVGMSLCPEGTDPCPWPIDPIKPPGLLECSQLLQYGNFEGSGTKIFSVWHAGPAGAYYRGSTYHTDGTLSMRLHTTLYESPGCNDPVPNPYLYQAISIPTEVYTQTTLTVQGNRLVAESESGCCYDTTDPDDLLYLKMRDGGGSDISSGDGELLAHGGLVTQTWESFAVDVTSVVRPFDWAGQDVQVYFHGIQDIDQDCTFFYLDTLECEMCTYWDIPEPIGGMASFGGNVQLITHGGVPRKLQGVDVWAYSPTGGMHHTQSIHDGTYHFYNVEPGTYTIYAEYWEAGSPPTLYTAIVTVTVGPDEHIDTVHLFL